jgi:hypothetical protein
MLCGLPGAEPSILPAGIECFTPKGLESPEEARRRFLQHGQRRGVERLAG